MAPRTKIFYGMFTGILWTWGLMALLLTHFFFQPRYKYFANSGSGFKGLLFLVGISLLWTPLFRKFENAFTATLSTIAIYLLAEDRYGHWSTLLFQFRQFLGENAFAVVARFRCFLFPNTFYCWDNYLRSGSYPPYIAFVAIALINAAFVWLICLLRKKCFPGQFPDLPRFFRKPKRDNPIFEARKTSSARNSPDPKQE